MSRIAIFTNSVYTMGGEQRVVSTMANEFAKHHHVTIFTMDSPNNNDNLFHISNSVEVKRYLPYKGDIISFAFRVMTHLTPWLVYDVCPCILERAYCHKGFAKKMYELICDEYDVVIATAWQLTIILGQVCKLYSHNFIAIGWEHSSFEAYFREKYIYLYQHEVFFAENAKYLNHVVVLNQDYAEKYKRILNINCRVIYNPKSFSTKKKSLLTNKCFVACGRFDRCKGFDLLIEAFNIYARNDKGWKLLIAGNGNMEEKLKKRVNELNLSDRVTFLGRVNNIPEVLLSASVYLLSSRFEGFPMCVIEAYEVGLPVVAFDIPAMIPFKEKGVAITVDCYDIQQYAEAMQEMAHSYEKRCVMGNEALEFAEMLAPERIAEEWEKLI